MLRHLLNLPRSNTRRTYADAAAGAIYDRAHGLQVQVPAALGNVMRVADTVSELRPAATHFTNSCHKSKVYQFRAIAGSVGVPNYFSFSNFFRISAASLASGVTSRYFA